MPPHNLCVSDIITEHVKCTFKPFTQTHPCMNTQALHVRGGFIESSQALFSNKRQSIKSRLLARMNILCSCFYVGGWHRDLKLEERCSLPLHSLTWFPTSATYSTLRCFLSHLCCVFELFANTTDDIVGVSRYVLLVTHNRHEIHELTATLAQLSLVFQLLCFSSLHTRLFANSVFFKDEWDHWGQGSVFLLSCLTFAT